MMTDNADDARHRAKMAKRKAVQDAEVASKTVEKGLLIVHTGPGKGKSTAAFGLVLRALGHGWRVGVVQFIKGAWETGERTAIETLRRSGVAGIRWARASPGRRRTARATSPRPRRAWAKARELMADPGDPAARARRTQHRAALRLSAARRGRRGARRRAGRDLHVVVTGRNAKPELIEAADLVTEMTLVKHHFAAGVKAQEGIEF